MATLYDMLGLRTDATEDEIKRAYRRAAMKWHPDRNAGQEDLARTTFQQIKEAYAILSDAGQRQVYDAVFAEELRRWENQRQREEREQAEREAAARAAAEAAYASMVAVAMRFASDGYNRDVLFGVLLGRQCDVPLANQIADSVWALHESRTAEDPSRANVAGSPAPPEPEERAVPEASGPLEPDERGAAEASAPGRRQAGVFDTLWHSFFGVRS